MKMIFPYVPRPPSFNAFYVIIGWSIAHCHASPPPIIRSVRRSRITNKKTWCYSSRRRWSAIFMPYRQAGKNPELCRSRKDQTNTRRFVSWVHPCCKNNSHVSVRHAVRVNPQFSNRMIEAARSLLNRYIPDIYLYSDVYKGDESGK